MDHATQLMNQGSDHVIQMNRVAQDTIELAADTMEMLDEQGNQISRGREKVCYCEHNLFEKKHENSNLIIGS